MARISASILSFLFKARQNKESDAVMIEKINKALNEKRDRFDILHLDIEDGKFTDYKGFSISQLRKIKCAKKKEAHLMVVDYKKYIKDYFHLTDMFIIQNEVIKSDFDDTISFLRKNKKFVGIALNPETTIDEIRYLSKIDLVLVMGIHPGAPGQKFIETTLRKIKKLKELRDTHCLRFMIEIDGGMDDITSKKCIDAGADIIEMGSHLFK